MAAVRVSTTVQTATRALKRLLYVSYKKQRIPEGNEHTKTKYNEWFRI